MLLVHGYIAKLGCRRVDQMAAGMGDFSCIIRASALNCANTYNLAGMCCNDLGDCSWKVRRSSFDIYRGATIQKIKTQS